MPVQGAAIGCDDAHRIGRNNPNLVEMTGVKPWPLGAAREGLAEPAVKRMRPLATLAPEAWPH